jgi:hypothetical protein
MGLSSRAFVTITILPSLRAVRISGQLTQPPASAMTACLISDQDSINANFVFDLGLSWPFAKSVPLSALQLQLLNAGKLVVTIFTQLYPSGELQGQLELLTCYDGAGSESLGGKNGAPRCILCLTRLQLVLSLFWVLCPLSVISLLSFLKHRPPLAPSLRRQIRCRCGPPHLY